MKATRDLCFQFNENYLKRQHQNFSSDSEPRILLANFLRLIIYAFEGSIEKIKNLPEIKPEMKDFFINTILPGEGRLSENDIYQMIKLGMISSIPLKNLALNITNSDEIEKFYTERLLHYYPNFFEDLQNRIEKSIEIITIKKLLNEGLDLSEIEDTMIENKKIYDEFKKLVEEEIAKNNTFWKDFFSPAKNSKKEVIDENSTN